MRAQEPQVGDFVGVPAKVVRELSDKDVAFLRANAGFYVERQIMYKAKLKRIG